MSDLDALIADLAAAAGRTRQAASTALRKTGLDIVRGAQQCAPVDTGALRASIGMDTLDALAVAVGPTVHYAPYLEYGTYKMAARPYMGPAGDAAIPLLEQAMEQIADQILGG